jgi:hypothetical protein
VPARGQAAVAVLALACLAGCGGTAGSSVVVRVGNHPITKTTVEHWVSVIKRGGTFSGFRGPPPSGTPHRRALAFLISSTWLIAEAASKGVSAPGEVIDAALTERQHGGGEFAKRLRATGQTITDIKLEMRAELAIEAIRKKLAAEARRVGRPEVVRFYRQHSSLFRAPESRDVEVAGAASSAAAKALVRRVGAGDGFARVANRKTILPIPYVQRTPEEASVARAMFAARPGVVSEPMTIDHNWIVFVVRKIMPSRLKPLASARGEVIEQLARLREQALAQRFDREYRARWVAKTKCEPGYVVPGCARSAAALGAYEDPFSR